MTGGSGITTESVALLCAACSPPQGPQFKQTKRKNALVMDEGGNEIHGVVSTQRHAHIKSAEWHGSTWGCH